MVEGKNSNAIFERLDRGLAIEGWFNLFPYSCERHLTTTISDHVPLLFQINDQQQLKVNVKHLFRFENMWVKDETCRRVVDESWKRGSDRSFIDLAG